MRLSDCVWPASYTIILTYGVLHENVCVSNFFFLIAKPTFLDMLKSHYSHLLNAI